LLDRSLSCQSLVVVLFTDSICVLRWLNTNKSFVSICEGEIKSVMYAHVSSQDNLADIATRGRSPEELTSSIWWNGPVWLAKSIQEWPDSKFTGNESLTEIESEIKDTKTLYEAKLFSGEDI